MYPVNFRDLPYEQQYKKYQWIQVAATRITRDYRKESFRPDCSTLVLGESVPSSPGNWSARAKYVLAKKSRSMEDLYEQQEADNASLGILKPKRVTDLEIEPDSPDWPPKFLEALKQQRLFEYREKTLVPPRKVPFKFYFRFECDDPRCKANHRMMIEDWELGALFWRLVDKGASQEDACEKVREKFFGDLCGSDKDTHFYVGTVLAHPKSWVVIGVFYPKLKQKSSSQGTLFDIGQ
ncbi:MAG TPA: hypothetical protein VM487_08295 [Phycisphaerae bacterium]|nr:hypothetical protein [Phycisphaerae bacterium]